MTALNVKAVRRFCRKVMTALDTFQRKVDGWMQRSPAITPVLFALLALALIFMANWRTT